MNALSYARLISKSELHVVLLLTFFYLFISAIMPHEGHLLDLPTWAEWIIYMREHGVRHIYDLYAHPVAGKDPGFVYGPVYMYLLYFYGKTQGASVLLLSSIYHFKSVILLFDVIGIWFALRFIPDENNRPFYALFFIFNIGLLYDTIGWGQNDSVLACCMLVAVYYSLHGQLTISGLCILLALLIKPQPIIFLPAFGLLWLPVLVTMKLPAILLKLSIVAFVGLFIVAPFLLEGTFTDYVSMVSKSTGLYPVASINAANFWFLVLKSNPMLVSDTRVWGGLSLHQWGLGMFALGYGVVVFPLFNQCYQMLTARRNQFDVGVVLLTFGLLPIVFYFFNTQMHERYAFTGLLFLGAYAVNQKDYLPFIVGSFANFWVMEKDLRLLKLYVLTDTITYEWLAILFLFVLVWGVFKLYTGTKIRPFVHTPVHLDGQFTDSVYKGN